MGAVRAEEIARGILGWYLITFKDGKEVLASAVLQAFGPADVFARAGEMSIDPGRGQIIVGAIPEAHLPPEGMRGRLLEYWEFMGLTGGCTCGPLPNDLEHFDGCAAKGPLGRPRPRPSSLVPSREG